MATAPTLASLDARLKIVESALAAAVQWRRPQLVVTTWPASSNVKSGQVTWARSPGVASTLAVTYSIDGGAKATAPSPVKWGPLTPGEHRIDFFVGGGSVSELSHSWVVTV